MDLEAALRQSEKLAAVGRLASSIAHEINNPLESVMNLVYLAQGTECSLETKQYLAAVDLELRRMKLITEQALRFSRQSTRPQAVSCTELLDSVLDLYQSRLANSGVSVDRRELPNAMLLCMESEIRQVLNNLVSNAIDAMHGKGGRLLIRTRNATDWRTGTRGISITLADTGSGISPETMKSIYDAFYTTKGIGGSGLGLWISKEIVKRHKGRLVARSIQQEGRTGTVFSLFLPIAELPATYSRDFGAAA
jgi:two-component system sporulation sensor kinase C